ncbi:hypothetical protein V8C86DRAFT_2743395 [Haematococcus lacustris]
MHIFDNSKAKGNNFLILSDELIGEVCAHCDHYDLLHLMRVCKATRRVVSLKCNQVWHKLYMNTFRPGLDRRKNHHKGNRQTSTYPHARLTVATSESHADGAPPGLIRPEDSIIVSAMQGRHHAWSSSTADVRLSSTHSQQSRPQEDTAAPPLPSLHPETSIDWRMRFKERWMQDAAARRVERRVALLKLGSAVDHLKRSIAAAEGQLQGEKARMAALEAEATSLRHVIQVLSVAPRGPAQTPDPFSASGAGGCDSAGSARATAWVPTAVQQSWGRLTAQAPVEPAWRLKQLELERAACESQCRVFKRQVRARRAELQAAAERLRAMQAG